MAFITDDIDQHIFMFLSYIDIRIMSAVNDSFNQMTNNELNWKCKFINDYGTSLKTSWSWKRMYYEKYRAETVNKNMLINCVLKNMPIDDIGFYMKQYI